MEALADLEDRQPGFPDPQDLRTWAEDQQRTARNSSVRRPPLSSAWDLPPGGVAQPPPAHITDDDQTIQAPPQSIPFGWAAIIGIIIAIVSIGIIGRGWLSSRQNDGASDAIALPTSVIEAPTSAPVAPTAAPVAAIDLPTELPPSVPAPTTVQIRPVRFRVVGTGSEGLFIRSDHETGSEPIKTLPEGTIVTIIGSDFSAPDRVYKHIRDPEGTEGWAAADFLRPVP
jgi:hypothetical protein